ncbi:hypothetical protein B0H19DRAFT_985911, partial [Mycena capillaripes]
MHSAGEKQFSVWLLLETLFQHLPPDIRVGLLYNIACQLQQSALKWGFLLDRYLDRLAFAVSVFHAFGHGWARQCIFHPRKRKGFGLTNGEGCECFWHSISHLIAHLHISGYHHRLYTLDTQIKHLDEDNLFKLAEWNQRCGLVSLEKRREATEALAMIRSKCGHSREYLKVQWHDQVQTQTKPLARRSKTHGQKTVAAVLALRQANEIRKTRVRDCEAAALDALDGDNADVIVQTKLALDKARTARTKVQHQLRQKEAALGVSETQELTRMAKNKYFELRMNARALKRRLRDLLQARKFERDRIERTSRR